MSRKRIREGESDENQQRISKIFNHFDDETEIPYELLELQENVGAALDKYEYLQHNLLSNKDRIDMFVDHRHHFRLEKLNCLVDECCHNEYDNGSTNQSPYIDAITSNALDDDIVKAPHNDRRCYQRQSISKWFRQKETNPMTNLPLKMSQMIPMKKSSVSGNRRNLVFYTESNVDYPDKLVDAILKGNIEVVRELLMEGADPNQPRSIARTGSTVWSHRDSPHVVEQGCRTK